MEIGMSYTSKMIAEEKYSAAALGSGSVAVFATPAMILLMEEAARLAVQDALPEGATTVGTAVNIQHLAATPVGANVSATAVLIEINGRNLTFEVEAKDDKRLIGKGIHLRAVIDITRFMSKLTQ